MTLTVHIVDDEETLRDSLGFLFASRGIDSRLWPSGEAFLDGWPHADCGCIVLDVRMGGMSGPQVLDALLARGPTPPVIFLTGHADVPLAVQSLKSGAFDFMEKPFNDNDLADLVIRALQEHQARISANDSRSAIAALFATLSPRETEVMNLILDGQLNKQIADRLGIAVRTVEVHRSRLLQKTGVRNSVELSRLKARLD